MPGGRLKQYGRGKPDGKADKGLLRQFQPVPAPKDPGGAPNKYAQVNPNVVRGKRAK